MAKMRTMADRGVKSSAALIRSHTRRPYIALRTWAKTGRESSPVRRMLAVTVIVAGVLAGCGSGSDSASPETVAQGTQAQDSQQHPKWPPGQKACKESDPEGHTNPAKILGNNAAGTTSEILLPVNVWSAGDCQRVTEVEAGAAGWHASAGSLSSTASEGPQPNVLSTSSSRTAGR